MHAAVTQPGPGHLSRRAATDVASANVHSRSGSGVVVVDEAFLPPLPDLIYAHAAAWQSKKHQTPDMSRQPAPRRHNLQTAPSLHKTIKETTYVQCCTAS